MNHSNIHNRNVVKIANGWHSAEHFSGRSLCGRGELTIHRAIADIGVKLPSDCSSLYKNFWTSEASVLLKGSLIHERSSDRASEHASDRAIE